MEQLATKQELYSGKVKTLYKSDIPDALVMHNSDIATAFNAKKKAILPGKGELNNKINAVLMAYLQQHGIKTHFIKTLNSTDCLVKKLMMLPVECIVRNYAAGSLCKRLGVEQGLKLKQPIFEFCYKSDELQDPLINTSHILALNYATKEQVANMQELSFQVNKLLAAKFEAAGLILADFKLEFGIDSSGDLVLADEITPDGARIWDADTMEILDKDRFRQDLGQVLEKYNSVRDRLIQQ